MVDYLVALAVSDGDRVPEPTIDGVHLTRARYDLMGTLVEGEMMEDQKK